MLFWLIPLIIGLLAFVVFIIFRARQQRVIAVCIKGFVSLMFLLTGLLAFLFSNNPHTTFGVFILVGLFFGLLGDVFLDLKYIDLKRTHMFTVLGFSAFAFGHACYVSGLLINFFDFSSSILYIIIPSIISVLLTIVTLLMEKFSKIRYGNMKPFVVIYGLVLFFTVPIYFSASIQSGWQYVTLTIISVSLISFALSDLILNNTYFALGFDGPVYIVLNHSLYYIAQFAIAVSLFFLV